MGFILFLALIICIVVSWAGIKRDVFSENSEIDFKPSRREKPFVRLLDNNKRGQNIVVPDNTPLHLKRGWEQSGNTYRGYYRTKYGAWRGEIRRMGDKFKVLIFKPPLDQLRNHSRWICIHREGTGKYRIDLYKNPKDSDVGAIVIYVEAMIVQSFEMT